VSSAHAFTPKGDLPRALVNQLSATCASLVGAADFFTLRQPAWLHPDGALEATSFYETKLLKSTLERLVDFDRINAGDMRFSVGAVIPACAESWSAACRTLQQSRAHRTDRTAVDARRVDASIEPPIIGRVSRQARLIAFRKVERHAHDNTRSRSPARRLFGDGVRFWPAKQLGSATSDGGRLGR
jgi:hypothetical protein